jgi:hypothetical protein
VGELPEYVDGLPNLSGSEQTVEAAIAAGRHRPVVGAQSPVDIAGIDSAFAVALHMHQPLIPARSLTGNSAQVRGCVATNRGWNMTDRRRVSRIRRVHTR